MHTLRLRPKEHYRIAEGHLWVFRDELVQPLPKISTEASGLPVDDLVAVESNDGKPLGVGFYHSTSKIAVRMLGTDTTTIDANFFAERFASALALRQRMMPHEEAYRLVFGEADLLSGLIIDIYGSVAVLQMLAAGMDRRRDMIVEALLQTLPHLTGVVERNSMKVREKEGLEMRDGIVWGTVPDRVRFTENGILLEVDLIGGQKTGYFLDQKTNRAFIGKLSAGKRVLDCFCNVGGFALNAAAGGATLAVGVDSSAVAIQAAEHHALLNELPNCRFEQANVFDLLRQYVDEGQTWDVVILDPPSFAKSRQALSGARAGYAELNRTALKLLRPGGLLVSASCTQLVPEHDLMDIIYTEAARLRRRLRLVHRGEQAADHPVLLAMPETQYLKFLVFDVLA